MVAGQILRLVQDIARHSIGFDGCTSEYILCWQQSPEHGSWSHAMSQDAGAACKCPNVLCLFCRCIASITLEVLADKCSICIDCSHFHMVLGQLITNESVPHNKQQRRHSKVIYPAAAEVYGRLQFCRMPTSR